MTTATKRQIKGARSLKARPEAPSSAQDQARLGSFPPPTECSEQLVIENQGLARGMAVRMARVTRMDLESLQAVADIGLLKGCRLWDPERINPGTGKPYCLSTCVVPYIRGAMLHYLRDKGHTSGVRFPDAWRDTAPRVRKLASEGVSFEVIAAEVGLPASDVEAILQAQRTPAEFDPELGDPRSGVPDPLDEAEEHHELAEALAIVDEAFAALHWGDQQMLVNGWQMPRGPRLALQPHGQFMFRVRRILQGLPVAAPRGKPLALFVAEDTTSAKPRLTASTQILETAEQLGLFGAYLDHGGKTPAADIGSAGEGDSEDQPPDR
jgi:DNA-directed RNA polymerase specialized sigma subunit